MSRTETGIVATRLRLFCARPREDRRGAIIVLTAVLLVVLLAIVAFGVDVGVMMMTRTEIQRSVDSGALAAAGVLAAGNDDPLVVARSYVVDNTLYGASISEEDVDVELGDWDESTRTFTPANDLAHITAVRVLARAQDRPLFFGMFAGHSLFDTEAQSIATFQPRDIVLVMDCSGSMNDDSEFKQMDQLGRSHIEYNQYEIYQQLGSPTFGNMSWQPRYISTNNDNRVLRELGLRGVPYPYPRGSWEDYINYVQTNSQVKDAGYKKRYGYLTFVQYLLEQRESYADTPDLWQTNEQPITAVKNATSILLAYIESVKADDRVGLSVYTHPDGGALLTEELTYDLQTVEDATRVVCRRGITNRSRTYTRACARHAKRWMRTPVPAPSS